jgi:hypothetical protein
MRRNEIRPVEAMLFPGGYLAGHHKPIEARSKCPAPAVIKPWSIRWRHRSFNRLSSARNNPIGAATRPTNGVRTDWRPAQRQTADDGTQECVAHLAAMIRLSQCFRDARTADDSNEINPSLSSVGGLQDQGID